MSESRGESLRLLEQEVGVLIRRVRRVIGIRARAVHESLQPASYLMLGYVAEFGPIRASAMAEIFDIDKGAISRQVQHLIDLGLIEKTPDPDDGRATLLSTTDEAVRRMQDVAAHRRKWLDEQLGDWSDEELAGFAKELGRYNAALSQPDPAGLSRHELTALAQANAAGSIAIQTCSATPTRSPRLS